MQPIEQLVGNCSLAQRKWGAQIAPEIRPDAGKFRTVVLKLPLKHHGLGGSRRLGQFAFGFPVACRITRRSVYDEDADTRAKIPRSHMFATAASRFRDRGAKSGFKNAQLLLGVALLQVE